MIAVLGLGIMGAALARDAARGGIATVAWDRNPERGAAFTSANLTFAANVADAVRDADVVVTMVADADAVMNVMQDFGALAAMKAGAYHFVPKPIDAEALLITVEEALVRRDKILNNQAEIQETRGRCASLTQREREVFDLVVEGEPTKLIAYRLGITSRTAEHHRAAVMRKMQARTISHLVRMALSLGPAGGGRGGEK